MTEGMTQIMHPDLRQTRPGPCLSPGVIVQLEMGGLDSRIVMVMT
jgi:hypothetical protein